MTCKCWDRVFGDLQASLDKGSISDFILATRGLHEDMIRDLVLSIPIEDKKAMLTSLQKGFDQLKIRKKNKIEGFYSW